MAFDAFGNYYTEERGGQPQGLVSHQSPSQNVHIVNNGGGGSYVGRKATGLGVGAAAGGLAGLGILGGAGVGLSILAKRPSNAIKTFEETTKGLRNAGKAIVKPEDFREGDLIFHTGKMNLADAAMSGVSGSATNHAAALIENPKTGKLMYPNIGSKKFMEGTDVTPELMDIEKQYGEGRIVFRPNFKDDAQRADFIAKYKENLTAMGLQTETIGLEEMVKLTEQQAAIQKLTFLPEPVRRAADGFMSVLIGLKSRMGQGALASEGKLRGLTKLQQQESFICSTSIGDALERAGVDSLPRPFKEGFSPGDGMRMKNGEYLAYTDLDTAGIGKGYEQAQVASNRMGFIDSRGKWHEKITAQQIMNHEVDNMTRISRDDYVKQKLQEEFNKFTAPTEGITKENLGLVAKKKSVQLGQIKKFADEALASAGVKNNFDPNNPYSGINTINKFSKMGQYGLAGVGLAGGVATGGLLGFGLS